ncbi:MULTISPECIES: hypothetical protein [Legionella]|uniref:Uncharacterized protein n=1 Tax=Legionella resiliens TaxID=2905958 RepID=A0ABS8WZ22_9GAMM|nr:MULTISPECIES: hypothetical protein [unclassified Legionella]MCE0721660.1 hypothetical protein [Legionella sp. 9fVS26]MCE3530814.1 hypothetical protein [Legionella sp. 8cVS16]QLZ70375.1 hypothetical protein FOLKNPGA_03189 [Legionella sp. PC1000]
MEKTYRIVFLCLFLISGQVYATVAYLRYSGKCQFTLTRERYAYCLEKEMVFYDREFSQLYSHLTPEASLLATDALATQIIEPNCDAIAMKIGAGLEYHIAFRICMIHITKEKIACIKRFIPCQMCWGRKLVNSLRKPYLFLENVSVHVSDPT